MASNISEMDVCISKKRNLSVCADKIAFDWTNCLISYKNNTKISTVTSQ